MARVAWEVWRTSLSEAAVEPQGVPGAVISLQTFGSFGANFHPHLHGIVTEGVFTTDGVFHPVIWPEAEEGGERFRRRLLPVLEKAGWLRPETPPDPRTGSTSLDVDELELVHALRQQVPPPAWIWTPRGWTSRRR